MAKAFPNLRKLFAEAVEDYLDFCKEKGIEPQNIIQEPSMLG